jgi:hypothetical protein
MKNCDTNEHRTTRGSLLIACVTTLAVVFTVALPHAAHNDARGMQIATAAYAQQTARVQELPLRDATGLVGHNVKLEAAEHLGRKAVKVTKDPGSEAFALVSGSDFQDGTIEVDVAVKPTTPPGVRMPGFIGVGFRVRSDGSTYDLFYIRPGNARATDQAMRNHAVQYCAGPKFGWYELRRAWPWVYEAYTDIDRDAWTHLKIDVAGRTARIFVNGAAEPALSVDGLKGGELRGAVALWGFESEEAYFSNLRITPATPQPITNGSDIAGTWETMLSTDFGNYGGTLQLKREAGGVSGEWSGALGQQLPVKGTWQNGYVELTFSGEWPKDRPGGGGVAAVTLAGWVDGSAGKGRGKIEDRADGQWTATRK